MAYFSNINAELLEKIPVTSGSVLEIGCAEGQFGAAFLARHPEAVYVGVELLPEVAAKAAQRLPTVLSGSIEDDDVLAAVTAAAPPDGFAVLVLGNVLEHLRDPWRALTRLRALLRPDGLCAACIPNVAHWSVVLPLLQGKWEYAENGLLDRTHLRFFTLESMRELFRTRRHCQDLPPSPAARGLHAGAGGL